MTRSGAIVAVVGPSGAGKDTLMDFARSRLTSDNNFTFVRRTITRPAEAGGETHSSVDEREFLQQAKNGAFAVWWHAHGLYYGIPASTLDDLRSGRILVVNGSRAALPSFRDIYGEALKIALITAPPEVLADRLAARGRESREEILSRLSRQTSVMAAPNSADVEINNDGDLEYVGEAFVRFLVGMKM